MAERSHHRVLIVGGGTAGITVAARLARRFGGDGLTIVEPSAAHYYQPLWTLVGGGVFPKEASRRAEADYIPKGAEWVRDAVASFHPEENAVATRDGRRLTYDYLVVAAGLQLDWGAIEGLAGNVGRDGICSNYSYETVESTWECISNFKGGIALFTMPGTPVKCGGAPQKIMYLADETFRKRGVRDRTRIVFASAKPTIFDVERYARTLMGVIARKGIETRFQHDLVAVRPEAREAVFRRIDTGESVTIAYDMIHVTPPMSAPDFIKQSPLAGAGGWVDVDRATLRHVRYPNVYALGDCSGLPTSKTGAAIRKQAPVLVENLSSEMAGGNGAATYDGYTSCPLITGYGKLVLAEFDYDKAPAETFPFDQSKERRSMYLLKAYGLPALYWHGMLRGRF